MKKSNHRSTPAEDQTLEELFAKLDAARERLSNAGQSGNGQKEQIAEIKAVAMAIDSTLARNNSGKIRGMHS